MYLDYISGHNKTKITTHYNTDNMGKLFVMVFAAPCSHDKSCWNLHPETRTCTQYKSCTVTVFWLRDNLYPRVLGASAPNKHSVPWQYTGFDKTCTATRPASTKLVPGFAKTTPYPPCTVTAFWLKYQDRDRMLRRVTQPPHIAGPLATSLRWQWTRHIN